MDAQNEVGKLVVEWLDGACLSNEDLESMTPDDLERYFEYNASSEVSYELVEAALATVDWIDVASTETDWDAALEELRGLEEGQK